jgi:hypothetical protein
MIRKLCALLAALSAGGAAARDEAGRLALILTPNSAQPAVLAAGSSLQTLLRENVPLRIESAEGAVIELEFTAARPMRGSWMVDSRIPQSVAPGVYTLVADGTEAEDSAFRAVYILDGRPETYRLAHVSNLRVGDPNRSDSRLFRLTAAINGQAPDLILVTGDLTAAGTDEQFRLAIDILNDCRAPTFVAPGAADNRQGHLESYLGPYSTALRFAADAYLVCSPLAGLTAAGEARLHTERRAVRAARWSIGAAQSFAHGDLRSALTLFVDDPLDYVFEADAVDGAGAGAWGRTRGFSGAAGSQVQWYTVGPRGIAEAAAEE